MFYLNSRSPTDLLDYWNLRALGWNIIPVSSNAATQENLRSVVELFVNENAYPFRGNPDIYNATTFLPSASHSMKDVEQFGGSYRSTSTIQESYTSGGIRGSGMNGHAKKIQERRAILISLKKNRT